jgi:hypothetical protein
MSNYYVAVRKVEDKFEGLEFHHIERDCNMQQIPYLCWDQAEHRLHQTFLSKKYSNQASHQGQGKNARQ